MLVDFYLVDNDYLNYLRNFDNRVSLNHDGARERPFLAVLVNCLGIDYLIPLSHVYKKKNLGVFPLKIVHSSGIELLGTLLINNMIPFRSDIATRLEIEMIHDIKYKKMLRKQWSIVREKEFQNRLEKAILQSYRFQMNKLNETNPIHINFNDYKRLEVASKLYQKK